MRVARRVLFVPQVKVGAVLRQHQFVELVLRLWRERGRVMPVSRGITLQANDMRGIQHGGKDVP